MKKHLPNLLLLLITIINFFLIWMYIRNNGFGLFLKTTGIIFLVLGIIIFIYFLSIDPAYKWVKSIDLTKNYIMIFVSMAVCMAGVVLIVTGQKVNELYIQSIHKMKRCEELIAGNAAEIVKKDWYSLRDMKTKDSLTVYLFQKKSNRNNYKVVVNSNDSGTPVSIENLKISSSLLSRSIILLSNQTDCPGVYEKNISIDYDKHQSMNEQVDFTLAIALSKKTETKTRDPSQGTIIEVILQSTKVGEFKKRGSSRVVNQLHDKQSEFADNYPWQFQVSSLKTEV